MWAQPVNAVRHLQPEGEAPHIPRAPRTRRPRTGGSRSDEIQPQTAAPASSFAAESIPAWRVASYSCQVAQPFLAVRLLTQASKSRQLRLCCSRIRFRRRAFELRQNLAQRANQFVARDMTLFELNSEPKRLILGFKLKDKRLRALWSGLLFPPLTARFIPRQAALQDTMQHLHHFLFGGLPRNLQQQRLRRAPLLDAFLPQRVRDIAQ